MRKIDKDAAFALLDGKSFKRGNTEVVDGKLYLFGNLIAKFGKRLFITSCGYETATTKARLNGVLDCFNTGKRITQEDYVWYLEDNCLNKEPFGSWWKEILL